MNKIILALLLAGFGTQLIKILVLWFKYKKITLNDLIVTGGMPSSHSAFAVSLATSIYLLEGTSTAFAISLVLAFIVVRDSFGVRRTVGEEGHVLVKVMKKLKIKTKVHYTLGHTPLQVLVGSLIGFVISLVVFYLL
ncbi:divergent PAP2 family protein [Candidatus Woesearchaeota archaeon]|nr:divergent PAP2 family protein [Candidatus Woesearchaeota archaeon]